MINENLFSALTIFSEEIDLDNDQRFGLLTSNINSGYINFDELKNELNVALSTKEFDWVGLAKRANLLVNVELYNNLELANYIKGWLWDYLYPEKILTESDLEKLAMEVKTLLQKCNENNEWIFSYDVYQTLKNKVEFDDLEYYNFWKIPFTKWRIERKIDNSKDREIGYLRLAK
jgi:hypothetical protein